MPDDDDGNRDDGERGFSFRSEDVLLLVLLGAFVAWAVKLIQQQ
jgi:hypothetical protein